MAYFLPQTLLFGLVLFFIVLSALGRAVFLCCAGAEVTRLT